MRSISATRSPRRPPSFPQARRIERRAVADTLAGRPGQHAHGFVRPPTRRPDALIRRRPVAQVPGRLAVGGISFVDMAGLESLLQVARETRAAGAHFEITAASQSLSRLTRMTGTDKHLTG